MQTHNTRSIKSALPAISQFVPAITVDHRPNDLSLLKLQVQQGRLRWHWPLIFCFLRFPLFLLGFLLILTALKLIGHHDAFSLAEGLTTYDLPIFVDLFCLILLAHVLRKEGLRLRDLINLSRQHFFSDLFVGFGLFLLVYILLAALSIGSLFLLSSTSFLNIQVTHSLLVGLMPLGLSWHIIISTILLPISTGCVEELLYRGYVQPRLQALTGNFWIALFVTAFGFGLQHLAFGLASWQLALSNFLTTFIAGLVFGLLNRFNHQRLLPLMLIHWQANLISLGIAPLLLISFLK